MDGDKKKKRNNKKKKNKQQQQQQAPAAVDDTASSNAGETSSQDQNVVEESDSMNPGLETVNGGVEQGSTASVEVKGGHDKSSNGNHDVSALLDTEKQKWLQEEAKLKEMLKQLLYEKDSYMQLQAGLESSNKQLQCEIDSWQEKEVSLKQRISKLVQDKADVSLEEENLREKVRHMEKEKMLLVENENSSKEQIATLSDENSKLRMQVLELEGASNHLSEENKQLLDSISTLDFKVKDLEKTLSSAASPEDSQKSLMQDGTDKEDLFAERDAAWTHLVEKLVTENAELVEKLTELYMELNRRSVMPGVSIEVPDPVSGSGEDISLSSRSTKQFNNVPMGNERGVSDDLDSDYGNAARHSSESTVSGEIVQIPLDEHEVQDLEAQTPHIQSDNGVPLTDAPLIGAPFRLIGFFAKYVSGADLVNKSSSDSLQ